MRADPCVSNLFSITASASTNSQFAGLLAGFLFTGFLILFGQRGKLSNQTMVLFVASFIVLGFDSYLFSMVSGAIPGTDCRLIWAQGMAASGLLATGSMGLVCGSCWLIVDYLETRLTKAKRSDLRKDELAKKLLYLNQLVILLPPVAQAGSLLLLAATTEDYLDVTTPHNVPLHIVAWALPTAFIIAIAVTAILRFVPKGIPLQPSIMYHASFLSLLFYSLFASVFAGLCGISIWDEPTPLVMALALLFGLGIPVALSSMLSASTPSLSRFAILKLRDSRKDIDEATLSIA